MKEPTENLSFLGPGYPLYFHFLKNTIYLLLIILLISGEFNIFSNYLSDNCIVLSDTTTSSSEDDGNSVFCVLDLITMFSLVNKTSKNEANEIQHYLNFSSVIGVIIFMIFYRKNQKELFLRIDLKETTPSDYTIIVKNIPTDLNIDIEKSLYEYFNFVDSKQYDVQNINLCYDLTERVKIHKAFQQLLKKKKQILISANANTNEKLTADLEKVNEEIEKKEFEMRNYDINISNNYPHFCGIALVTFNTVEEKREIIKKSRLTLFDRLRIFFNNRVHLPRGFLYYNSRLIIEQAPEPNEIQFNNLHSDSKEKFKIRIFTFLLTLLEMAGFGIIIYILLSYQYGYCKGVVASLQASQSFEESDEEMLEYYTEMLYVYLISGGISLLIVIINNVLVFFITKKIVKMEKYSTYTKKKISSAVRLSLVFFVVVDFLKKILLDFVL